MTLEQLLRETEWALQKFLDQDLKINLDDLSKLTKIELIDEVNSILKEQNLSSREDKARAETLLRVIRLEQIKILSMMDAYLTQCPTS